MYTAIVAAIASFPSLPLTMAAYLLLIEAAETAQSNATTKAKGTAGIRTTKINNLWTAMESLRVYVQGLADQLDHDSAVVLIQSAGLLLSAVPQRTKELLEAILDPTTNLVHLVANATMLIGKTSKKTTFNWQMSTDNKTWTNLPSSPYAATEIPSPGPGTYYFRVSAVVGKTIVPWTQAVNLTIH